MRILERSVYRGPHLYSATPMIRAMVNLGALEARPTDTIEGFVDRLLERVPGLMRHGCSFGEPGGLVIRLRDGTWLGHVVEHVCLELQTMAGAPVTRGKTRSVKGREGVYNVMAEYREEPVGLAAMRLAFETVESLLPEALRGVEGLDILSQGVDGPFDFKARVEGLKRLVERHALGPSTRALAEAAKRRGIPVRRLNEHSLLQLGWGSNQKRIQASITGNTSFLAVEAAGDKAMAKHLLGAAGLPVPRGEVVRSLEAAQAAAGRIRGAVVTKPLDGNHGRGVSVGLRTPEDIAFGYEQARQISRRVIVEEQYTGGDHRALVVAGKLVAVAERRPPAVKGDGKRTVADLVNALNADPRRGEGHEKVMTRVKPGPAMDAVLGEQGLDMTSVPGTGTLVRLAATANLSTGGSAIDRTDVIHPENRYICEAAARAIGLDVAGIDFICPDITRSVRETGGGIIEVNAAPGLRMHLHPSEGTPRDVAAPIIEAIYPRTSRARIPVIAVTGTNGKSTTVRMVAHMLRRQGVRVGYTTTSGIYIDDRLIKVADASGPASARQLLADPTVDAVVLETARGGIVREGLGFDRCDVGAVLNVTEDHVGLGGVNDIDDLAAVKSVVVESVDRRGYSVLNADDPRTLRMARHAGGEVIWFTMGGEDQMSGPLLKHVAEGGTVLGLDKREGRQTLVIRKGETVTVIAEAEELPAALGGAAAFNIANALAAAAIGTARGLSTYAIAEALKTFTTSFEQNPGRMNMHDTHGIRVIVDYAHNPAALSALGETIARLRPSHGRVIGVVSMPGDRRDEDLKTMGALSVDIFDQIVFRERPDGRGRDAGEVLRLLREGALEVGCPPERISTVLDEFEAVKLALAMGRKGDLVVLLPTKVEAVWSQVQAWRPASAHERDFAGNALHG
jgi:cyanophycin synthetase